MSSSDTVVVVGGSIGATRTVQALRRAGHEGRLVMVTEERHLPYDRPPLSKELLAADHSGAPVPLLAETDVASLDLEVRRSTRATGLDPAGRILHVEGDDGPGTIGYDALVIATGAAARRLPMSQGVRGVHVIRDLDDVTVLRRELVPGRRAVVVGAGFIGAEFASAAIARGLAVTLVEAMAAPLAHVLGTDVGAEVASLHTQHGAKLRTGAGVVALRETDGVVGAVRLDDGDELPADLVVLGVGAVPNTAWLDGSGLPTPDGIECDEDMQVLGFPGIYAVGDVARWPHPAYDRPIRIEHWTNAGDHAQVVAAHLVGKPRPAATVPYVWSDQYGHRIQIAGRPTDGSLAAMRGSAAQGDLTAVYTGDEGQIVGALVMDDPKRFLRFRKAILARTATADLVSDLIGSS